MDKNKNNYDDESLNPLVDAGDVNIINIFHYKDKPRAEK